MQRNIERAYDALWAEHQRIHRIHVKILAQGNRKLERRLMWRKLEDSKYLDELLDHEEQLTRPKRRQAYQLTSYGARIERLMDSLLRLK